MNKAYLDSFKDILFYTDNKNLTKNDIIFQLNNLDISFDLIVKDVSSKIYQIRTKDDIDVHLDYNLMINNQNYQIVLGNIVDTKEYDIRFQTEEKMGYFYHHDHTDFKLWAPALKEVYVVVEEIKYQLQYQNGVWHTTIYGNLEGKKYYYYVRYFDFFEKTNDPYGDVLIGLDNYIIDENKLYQFIYERPQVTDLDKTIIYEANIRDLTSQTMLEDKGLFKAILEDVENIGFDYIKNIGITHIQIMPLNSFAGIDEVDKKIYNWGYNPLSFFSITNYYSNELTPYQAINDFRKVVDLAHKKKLMVTLDVVYNHMYDVLSSCLEITNPGYYFRKERSYFTSDSGCGNDIASEKIMVRKLILDSVLYLTKRFNLSGLRFDLMGLLDIETINVIRNNLPLDILVYGEGWKMNHHLNNDIQSHMYNEYKMPNVGFFNDFFRDYVKNLPFSKINYQIINIFLGSPNLFKNPHKSINYVDCHDGLTIYDYLRYAHNNINWIRDYVKLFLMIVLFSKGIPFIHMGSEFLRTKLGVHNSFNSCDYINGIDYQLAQKNSDLVTFFKDIVEIRKDGVFGFLKAEDITGAMTSKNSFCFKFTGKYGKMRMYVKNNYILEIYNEKMEVIFDCDHEVTHRKILKMTKPGIYIAVEEV